MLCVHRIYLIMDMYEKPTLSEQHEELVSDLLRNVAIIENIAQQWLQSSLPGKMQYSHYAVLGYLNKNPRDISPAMLADVFHVRRPSMTNTLSKLEKMGYITLHADPNDGRAKLVSATRAGVDAHHTASQALMPVYTEAANAIGGDLLRDICPQLKAVRDVMFENYS